MSCIPDVRWRGVGLYAAVVGLWCLLAPWGASAEQFTGKEAASAMGIPSGAALDAVKAARSVLNGEDEETGR
jgi:hypothetical protein